MKAGFARECITPPIGTRMMGWGGRDSDHGCEGVHDDLYTRALWIEDDRETVLVIATDVCFFSRDIADRLKGAIGRHIELSPRQIMLNTSHTHAGPATSTFGPAVLECPDRPYLELLEAAVVGAAVRAKESAREATVSAGAVRCPISWNRRLADSEGRVDFGVNPDGLVYDEVPVCLFTDNDGEPVCLLFSVSCHLTTFFGFLISADYAGAATEKLDLYLGRECSMFLQGVGGDAKVRSFSKPFAFGRTWDDVERAAQIIVEGVSSLLSSGMQPVETALAAGAVEMNWPMQSLPDRAYIEKVRSESGEGSMERMWSQLMLALLDRGIEMPTSISIALHVVHLGHELRLVGLEGEAVAGLGFLIRDFFDSGITFPMGYTDGCQLYLPTTQMISEGGYEVSSYIEYGFPAPLSPGMEEIIKEGLESLKGIQP